MAKKCKLSISLSLKCPEVFLPFNLQNDYYKVQNSRLRISFAMFFVLSEQCFHREKYTISVPKSHLFLRLKCHFLQKTFQVQHPCDVSFHLGALAFHLAQTSSVSALG